MIFFYQDVPNCYAPQPYAYEYATPVSAYADWNYTSDAASLAQYSSKMASHGGGPLLDVNPPSSSSPLQNGGSSLDYGGYHQSYQTSSSPYSIDTGKSQFDLNHKYTLQPSVSVKWKHISYWVSRNHPRNATVSSSCCGCHRKERGWVVLLTNFCHTIDFCVLDRH